MPLQEMRGNRQLALCNFDVLMSTVSFMHLFFTHVLETPGTRGRKHVSSPFILTTILEDSVQLVVLVLPVVLEVVLAGSLPLAVKPATQRTMEGGSAWWTLFQHVLFMRSVKALPFTLSLLPVFVPLCLTSQYGSNWQ